MALIEQKYYLTGIKPPFKDKEIELNRQFINHFYFIENIENLFLTGEIEFKDNNGFFEKLPLTGEEGIKVVFEQNFEDQNSSRRNSHIIKTVEFDIFNVSIPRVEGTSTATYKFSLVEKGAFSFMSTQYSKSYVNKKISDIIKDVCINQLSMKESNLKLDTTQGAIDYIIPYWKPSLTIKDLCKRAKRDKSPVEGSYLFYSTLEDDVNKTPIRRFVSFATLLEQTAGKEDWQKYYYKKKDINPNLINNYRDVRNPNYSKRSVITNGIGGKRYFGVELTTDKKVFVQEAKYSEFVKNYPLLGKTAYLSLGIDELNSDVEFIGGNLDMVKAYQDYSFRMAIEGFNRREVIIDGSLDRWCGKVINVEQMSDSGDELYNALDSGKWLIKAVTHFFQGTIYEQKMIVLKDAYAETDLTGFLSKGK